MNDAANLRIRRERGLTLQDPATLIDTTPQTEDRSRP